MRQHSPPARGVLPAWVVWVGSALLVYHLAAIGLAVLDAPSGPWPNVGLVAPPPFARALNAPTGYTHGRLLKVTSSYRFDTNRPGVPGVFFEVRLKDDKGDPLTDGKGKSLVLRFPEKDANPWVRQRQVVLARQLADDLPVEPPMGEVIAPPGGTVPTVVIWDVLGERSLKTKPVPQHLLPRDRPAMRPSEWELLLAHAYARHLCRAHGAASAEVVRHTREAIPPMALFQDEPPPPAAFEDLIASYGEVRP